MTKKKTTKNVSAYDLLAEITANQKTDKIRTIETELNIDPNGYVEIDPLRKYEIIFLEGENDKESYLVGNKLYLNIYRKKVNEIIFEFWKIVGKQLPELRKNIAKANNYLHNSKINVLPGFIDELLEDMASDEYAIHKVPDITLIVVENLIPFATFNKFGTYESEDVKNIVKRRLKDENALVMIRRDYLNMIKIKLENELKGTPTKRISLIERKRLSEALEQEATERGFGDKKPPMKAPMVNIARKLGAKVSDSDTFEKCVKSIIKTYENGNLDVKKDERENMLVRVAPVVNEFLIPYFKRYLNEISMSKRGPLRELITEIMSDVANNKTTIANIDITATYNRIVLDDSVGTSIKNKIREGGFKSANERAAEKR